MLARGTPPQLYWPAHTVLQRTPQRTRSLLSCGSEEDNAGRKPPVERPRGVDTLKQRLDLQ